MRWAWIIGAILLLIAAGSVWFAFQSPTFVAGLSAIAAAAAWKAVAPQILKRMPPEEEAEWRAAERAGRGAEWLKERARKRQKGLL